MPFNLIISKLSAFVQRLLHVCRFLGDYESELFCNDTLAVSGIWRRIPPLTTPDSDIKGCYQESAFPRTIIAILYLKHRFCYGGTRDESSATLSLFLHAIKNPEFYACGFAEIT